jgi:hypothetical protein
MVGNLKSGYQLLQVYRRQGKRKEDEARLEKEVQLLRKEIDEINGWYYGRKTRQLSHGR